MEPFQKRATKVIDIAFGGEHHVDKLAWKMREATGWPSFCEFYVFGDMATWDYNELTKLVVAAHDQCVRANVRAARGKKLQVMLSDRVRTEARHPLMSAHPTLEDHVARIRGQIGNEEFKRRLTEPTQPEPINQPRPTQEPKP